MHPKLKEKTLESLSAVLPITGIVLLLSIVLIPMDLGSVVMFLVGSVMLIVGMGFFQLGAEISMEPIGVGIGVQISKTKRIFFVVLLPPKFIFNKVYLILLLNTFLGEHNEKISRPYFCRSLHV